MGNRDMPISRVWPQAAILTFIFGFAVLGYLAALLYSEQPPIPQKVSTTEGTVLFSRDDVMAGQHLFQKYGLMQSGTLFGHGAYLGPDFTAQYLHMAGQEMFSYYLSQGLSSAEAAVRVKQDLKTNLYEPGTGILLFGPAQSRAFDQLVKFYKKLFGSPDRQTGLRMPYMEDPDSVRQLTAYFSWAAWTTSALRPGKTFSYTNNWPPEPMAGNVLTADSFIWSVISLIALLGGIGLILFFSGRYSWLGWERYELGPEDKRIFRQPETVPLTPAQRATSWYFLVIAGLFLFQGTLGGVNAHYHVEPHGFYGLPISEWLPYNLSRTWHVQLALFFVTASFLAMGIFIAPMIARREPRHQSKIAGALFGALVIIVIGSLLGEAASIRGVLSADDLWFWIGDQGWEYLDLGRLWQILLVSALVLWLIIVIRGLRSRLKDEHPTNLPWVLLYGAFSIPLFYATGLLFGISDTYAVVDFWRFWVVHLWVEDFLELFTTIMVAYMFVLIGVVRPRVALTVIYLDVVLYSIGGVIGTMHHLYFSGTPPAHMAFGAFFSAMEVIPLVLLTYEAWRFMQIGAPPNRRTMLGTSSAEFPHKWAVMFLIAVGFWNFLGAGIFGFLVNLPIVSYYEIGTQFTANHAHGALMGVYGMLAMGFFMFVARYFIPPDKASNRSMAISFWGLNTGLFWMVFLNLFPVGYLQLRDSVSNSYWHARAPGFFQHPVVQFFEWLRLPGDLIFITAGILPVLYLAIRMFLNRNRYARIEPGSPVDEFTERRT